VPIGVYLINKWLEEFAFKANMPFTSYLIVILSSLAIAFITVGIQVFRVVRANPVNSLRSE
jgi:putative ABC transport system permease protein